MDELGVSPNEASFASAVGACGEVGEWLPACEAIKDMR